MIVLKQIFKIEMNLKYQFISSDYVPIQVLIFKLIDCKIQRPIVVLNEKFRGINFLKYFFRVNISSDSVPEKDYCVEVANS